VFEDAAFLAEYGIPNVLMHNNFSGVVLAVSDAGFADAEAELGVSSGQLAGALLAQVQCRPCLGLASLPPPLAAALTGVSRALSSAQRLLDACCSHSLARPTCSVSSAVPVQLIKDSIIDIPIDPIDKGTTTYTTL